MPEFRYRDWELFDAIDAVKAHDLGAVDSGVSDPAMKEAIADHLYSLSTDDLRSTLARYVRRFLTDEAIAAGYGLHDVIEFHEWWMYLD